MDSHYTIGLDFGTNSVRALIVDVANGKEFAEYAWGYSRGESEEDFAKRYLELLRVIRSLPVLAGFCYTQFADTYQEANGLLFADRTPKFPVEQIALATRGPRTRRDFQLEWEWRERLMNAQRQQYVVPSEDRQTTNDPH